MLKFKNELRLYRVSGKNKVRIARLKSEPGLFAWIKLYFTLKKYSVKG